jgi:hypothetical protein
MGKLGWTFPVAGLLVSLAGLMGSGLLGQSPHAGAIPCPHAVELLSPEFDPGETFQTPVLELATETVSEIPTNPSGLPVIEPLRGNRTSEPTSIPVHQPIFKTDPMPGLPVSPGFSTSQGIPRESYGLPALPQPGLPCPGHSRGLTADPPRPGHSKPKRFSESDLKHRPH